MTQRTADYRDTINLPETAFPMRAHLPLREPERQAQWRAVGLYQQLRDRRRGAPKFVLHDGPPFSNGDIHLGTALNKILKDIVVRYRNLRGYDAPYIPGWDCHGLPTERVALERSGQNRKDLDPLAVRRIARETALHFQQLQSEQFQRLGVMGDWEHPYLTLQPEYEGAVLGVFEKMVEQGWVSRGLRPVLWCPQCETALAEAEIEYHEATSPSVYLKFAADPTDKIRNVAKSGDRPWYFIAWTTTPWTLPANVALAVHPEFDYGLYLVGDEGWILATGLVDPVFEEVGVTGECIHKFNGAELAGLTYQHPFLDRQGRVVTATHVRADQGTGIVHTAPGHGAEDFYTGQEYGLPVVQPLDDAGVFTAEGGQFAGLFCFDADPKIVEELKKRGALVHAGSVTHAYPHCWRSKGQVIFRATQQWFLDVAARSDAALRAIDAVDWKPSWGKTRILSMVEGRPDWCISRQRAWGVPIPAFFCKACEAPLLTPETVASVRAVVTREGTDAWWQRSVAELLPKGVKCACGGTQFRKGNDIFDVWFESGSSHAAVLKTRPELTWPADLYLEGHDQYRGWFQSSLWTGLALEGRTPYNACVGHGFTQDESGHAMHKSLGNAVDPLEVIAKHGADVVRLWVTYEDFRDDMVVSNAIFDQVAECYRRIRNTLRFLLANLGDFDPTGDEVEPEDLTGLDRWARHRLLEIGDSVTRAYEDYDLHAVYYHLHTFCATDLSAFYLDALKDRLYCEAPHSVRRRAAQTVLYATARHLCLYLAPILPHTCEEVWEYLPRIPGDAESVHLADWPEPDDSWRDDDAKEDWELIKRQVRPEVHSAIDRWKQEGKIKQPLEASVKLYPRDQEREAVERNREMLPFAFGVSQVEIASESEVMPLLETADVLPVGLDRAEGRKCARCWLWRPEVGEDVEHPTLCGRCVAVMHGRSAGDSGA